MSTTPRTTPSTTTSTTPPAPTTPPPLAVRLAALGTPKATMTPGAASDQAARLTEGRPLPLRYDGDIPVFEPLKTPEPTDDLPIIGETPVTFRASDEQTLLTWASKEVATSVDSPVAPRNVRQGHALICSSRTNLQLYRLQHRRRHSHAYEDISTPWARKGLDAALVDIVQAATSPDLFADRVAQEKATIARRSAKRTVSLLQSNLNDAKRALEKAQAKVDRLEGELTEGKKRLKALLD